MLERNLTCVVPVSRLSNIHQELIGIIDSAIASRVHLILVHDIQDEESGRILNSILENRTSVFIEIHSGVFGNPGSARNYGMKFVRTKWVAFSDGDDVPQFENMIALVSLCENSNSDLGVGAIEVNELCDPFRKFVHFPPKIEDISTGLALFPAFTRIVYNNVFLQNINFIASRMGEDQIFVLEILNRLPKFVVTSETVYTYLVGRDFQATNSESAFNDLALSIRSLLDVVPSSPKMQEVKLVFLARLIMTFVKRNPREIFSSLRQDRKRITGAFSLNPTLLIKVILLLARKRVGLFG